MMQLLMLIILLCLHHATGAGLLNLLKAKAGPVQKACLSIISGIFIDAFLIFLMQLAFIPLNAGSIFSVLIAAAVLFNIPFFKNFKSKKFNFTTRLNIKIYEWPFIIAICFLLFITIWRCYYMPPGSRDALSGPEAIASFAVKEQTLINSVYTLDLSTTNNQYKSPFLHGLQLFYKLAGFPYGSLWLSMLSVSFFVFIYSTLRKIIHPIFTGVLVLLLIAIPEMYAYNYIALYDFSNMVFFFLAIYFLNEYLREQLKSNLYIAAFFFGASVYIRSETLLLIFMLVPFIVLSNYLNKRTLKNTVQCIAMICLPGIFSYVIVIQLYNNYYLPTPYNIGGLLNTDILNLQPLWVRMKEVSDQLIFSDRGRALFGYIFYIFFAAILAEIIAFRKIAKENRIWLYTSFVVLLGLCIIGFVFPLLDVTHSTKRGFFKAMPLIIFYLAHNQILQFISGKIYAWENASATHTNVAPKSLPKQQKLKPSSSK